MTALHNSTNGAGRPPPVKVRPPQGKSGWREPAVLPTWAAISTPYGNIEVAYVKVSPEQATEWVENSTNRPVRTGQVEKIAAAMTRGLWRFNGEPLVLDQDGVLLDGQHRCRAAIQTGIAFETLLISGVRREVFDTFDQNTIRTVADALSLEDVVDAKDAASLLRLIAAWRGGHGPWVAKQHQHSIKEIRELAKSTPNLSNHINAGRRVAKAVGGGRAFYGFMHWLLSLKNAGQADVFFDHLAKGENLSRDRPVLVLRNHILAAQKARAKTNLTVEHYATFVNAWNAERQGRTLRMLRGVYKGVIPTPE